MCDLTTFNKGDDDDDDDDDDDVYDNDDCSLVECN